MNVEEFKINLDETYINVIRFGSGPKPMVIISGITLSGLEGHGMAVATSYDIFNSDYTTYLFERRKEIPFGFSVNDMSEDIYTSMQYLGISGAYVYGVSQGGMIAQELAINHPNAVKKLVLCSTMSRPTETIKPVYEEWLYHIKRRDVQSFNHCFFNNIYSEEFIKKMAKVLPSLEKRGSTEDCERFQHLCESIPDFNAYDRLETIACPVLVLGDKRDKTVGIEGSTEIIEKLNCESYIYDCYSHAVFDEAPDIKERIKVFFDKN